MRPQASTVGLVIGPTWGYSRMVSKIARAIASYLLHRARKSAKLHNRVMGLSRARSTRSSIDLRFNVARIIATNNLEAKDTAPVAFPSDASSYLLLALVRQLRRRRWCWSQHERPQPVPRWRVGAVGVLHRVSSLRLALLALAGLGERLLEYEVTRIRSQQCKRGVAVCSPPQPPKPLSSRFIAAKIDHS